MTQTTAPSRNESVDTFNLLALFFIIIVNVGYPSFSDDGEAWVKLSFRWVIPFLFIINGYFLAVKNENAKTLDVRALVERLAWLFFIWNLIYLPVKILNEGLSAFKVFNLLISPILIFIGTYYHLWAVSSLLFGVLFIAIMQRFGAKGWLPVVAIACLIIGLIGGGYQIFKLGFVLGFNIPRFWLSIPFVYLGMISFQKGRPAWQVAALLAVFGAVLQVFEAQYILDNFQQPLDKRQFLIGTIFLAYGMASLILRDLKFLRHPLLAKWGREYALGAYLLHPLISAALLWILFNFAPALAFNKILQVLFPVAVFSLSLAAVGALKKSAPALHNLLLGIRTSASPQN